MANVAVIRCVRCLRGSLISRNFILLRLATFADWEMAQVKVGLGMFGAGTLVWILLTSVAGSLWFSQRVQRVLKQRGKPFDLPSVKALLSDSEYSGSDVYGALLGWIGCAVTFVALIMFTFEKS